MHYQKVHAHRCSGCHKNFPDEHFLDLHIAENHDPIKAALRDKGEKTVGHFLFFESLFLRSMLSLFPITPGSNYVSFRTPSHVLYPIPLLYAFPPSLLQYTCSTHSIPLPFPNPIH